MNWLTLTILSVVARATYSIATKTMSKNVAVSSTTQAVLLGFFGGLITLILSPLIGGINFEDVKVVPTATILSVVSQAFGNVLFFKGIKSLGAGTTQIAFSSIIVWGVILSTLFLNSSFSVVQMFGIVLMLFAILLVQYNKGRFKLSKGVLLIVASAGLFSIFQVTSASISNIVSTGGYLVLSYFGSGVIIALLYYKDVLKDYSLMITQLKRTILSVLFASGTSLLYFIFSYFAYRVAPDRGVVVILLTSQVILSVLFGIVFLRERENIGRKLFAGILAFTAAMLIRA